MRSKNQKNPLEYINALGTIAKYVDYIFKKSKSLGSCSIESRMTSTHFNSGGIETLMKSSSLGSGGAESLMMSTILGSAVGGSLPGMAGYGRVRVGMVFTHLAWVDNSYNSSPPAAGTIRTKSTGGFN